MISALPEQRGSTQTQPANRGELALVADSIEWWDGLPPAVYKWAPLVEDFNRALAISAEEAEPYADAIESLIYDSRDPERSANIIECLSAYPLTELKLYGAQYVDYLLQAGDEDQIFRTSRRLLEDDEVAAETMQVIVTYEHSLPLSGIKKVMEAASTRWYERRQGLHEQFRIVTGRDPRI